MIIYVCEFDRFLGCHYLALIFRERKIFAIDNINVSPKNNLKEVKCKYYRVGGSKFSHHWHIVVRVLVVSKPSRL